MPDRSIAVFDLGGVLIDWNPRHLYRKLFAGDDAAMEHFLANVCTTAWNSQQDAGRTFADACASLKLQHPDHEELIDAWFERQDEMLAGPISGTVEILAELRARGVLFTRSATGPRRLFRLRRSGSNSCSGLTESFFPPKRARSSPIPGSINISLKPSPLLLTRPFLSTTCHQTSQPLPP